MAPRTVNVVPHTHWDREWYAPFQSFRLRLVELLDDLLPRLEADPDLAHFLLDGQMAVVDDHLAMRPEHADRLRRLAASGRLAMGPWYVLPDEFLVSGETLVRDLQLGLERAAAFGGAMEVGYLPDMFGHVAQMPQILGQFGFEHAVVWRGVPAAVDRSGFWWEGPDGSAVRAEYLPEGYGNGATLPDDAKELVAMVRRFEQIHGEVLIGDLLWMNGTDHLTPQPWLGRVVAEANASQDDLRFVITSLPEHLHQAPTEGLPRWHGELRSGARANLLMGVTSNRVDVRKAAARAERALERLAEPLSALFLPADRWPAPFLAEGWINVVRNAAHDSVCACSVDDVVDAVLVRYAEARHVGEGLAEQAVTALAASVTNAGPLVVNPTARRRSGLLELRFPGHEPCPGAQVLAHDDGVQRTEGIVRADCVTLVQHALDNYPHLLEAEVVIDDDGVMDVTVRHDPARRRVRYAGPIKGEVATLAAAAPDAPARMAVVAPTSHTAVVRVSDLVGFGWTVWEPADLDIDPVHVHVPTGSDRSRTDQSSRTDVAGPSDRHGAAGTSGPGGPVVANGLVRIEVDPRDGTLTLTELTGQRRQVSGVGRLVDGGDTGDTYNFDPPAHDTLVEEPDAVEVQVLEHGPLRGRVKVVRRFTWPERVAGERREGTVRTEVRTTVELEAGSPLVRVTVELDNRARDHRLRLHVPLPERATHSSAECAFAVVDRGLVAEGGPTERALPTFPARRFVAAGGLVVLHDGVHEHELVDLDDEVAPTSAGELAVTLLRATGLLSNGPMPYRALPAGPVVPTPGAQVPGRHTTTLGLAFDAPPEGGGRWAVAYALADELTLPLLTTRAEGTGDRPARGQALDVDGAEVSAVLRRGEALEMRVFNPSPAPTTVVVAGRRGWRVDLRGRVQQPFEERLELGPWQVATLMLDPASG